MEECVYDGRRVLFTIVSDLYGSKCKWIVISPTYSDLYQERNHTISLKEEPGMVMDFRTFMEYTWKCDIMALGMLFSDIDVVDGPAREEAEAYLAMRDDIAANHSDNIWTNGMGKASYLAGRVVSGDEKDPAVIAKALWIMGTIARFGESGLKDFGTASHFDGKMKEDLDRAASGKMSADEFKEVFDGYMQRASPFEDLYVNHKIVRGFTSKLDAAGEAVVRAIIRATIDEIPVVEELEYDDDEDEDYEED